MQRASTSSGRADTLEPAERPAREEDAGASLREGGGPREDSGRRGGRPEPPPLNSAKGTERSTSDCLTSLRAKSARALTTVNGQLSRAQFRAAPALRPKPPAPLAGLSQGLTGSPASRLRFPSHFSEAPSLSETCLWQSPLSVPIFLSLETVHSLNLQACS